MAPKTRKSKTSRRRKISTAGKILPPLDVRSNKQLKEFERRIKQGDLTIVLVWAPWCGHCHKFMPHFDAAAKSPNRSVQAVKVEETMLPAVNEILRKNVNKSAAPLNVEGYPSIIVVDKQGNTVTNIEPVKNTSVMKQVMENAGPLAKNAGLNTPTTTNSVPNTLTPANIGIPESGLVSGNIQKNIDIGEDELKGSIASINTLNKNIKLKSIPLNNTNMLKETEGETEGEININTNANTKTNTKTKNNLKKSIASSSLNIFNASNASKNTVIEVPTNLKKLSQEASEITSLATPLTPPNPVSDNENVTDKKVSGGGCGCGGAGVIYGGKRGESVVHGESGAHGGSLYSSLIRTTYTLAPTAALLATAAMVMKKTKKTKKTKKVQKAKRTVGKSAKTLRRRR